MGPVPAAVVIATFYNFNPELISRVIPAAWERAAPAAVLAARLQAADRALRRGLGEDTIRSPEMQEAADLARRAAEAASARPQGRPLFGGHAALPWPEEPHLVLWHAQTLLREYRGDAHVAALLHAGLDAVEALVSHAAAGDVPASVLQESRAWPDDAWHSAVERMRTRGLLTDDEEPTFTESGRTLRQQIEDTTDARSVDAYEAIGEDGCDRLRRLARPFSQAVVGGGLLPR